MRIFTLNVCGIRSKIETPDFIESCKKYDVLCFSETKTDDIDTPEMMEKFKAMGFQMFVRNRHKFTNRWSGGLIIAVSYKIADKCVQKSINSDLCVCLKIKTPTQI